jgi:hypothetical protein
MMDPQRSSQLAGNSRCEPEILPDGCRSFPSDL